MSVKQYDSQNKILKLIAGGTLFADCPVGVINPYGGATAPDGWLLCHGQALSRTEYADLFAVIGTNFGSGDGSTTFNLPDMREATTKGAGLTGKTVGSHVSTNGLAVGEFLDDRLQTHQHIASRVGTDLYVQSITSGGYTYGNPTNNTGNNTGRTGATTEVKAVGVNYIMKVKQTPVPADVLTKLEELLADKDYLTFSGS